MPPVAQHQSKGKLADAFLGDVDESRRAEFKEKFENTFKIHEGSRPSSSSRPVWHRSNPEKTPLAHLSGPLAPLSQPPAVPLLMAPPDAPVDSSSSFIVYGGAGVPPPTGDGATEEPPEDPEIEKVDEKWKKQIKELEDERNKRVQKELDAKAEKLRVVAAGKEGKKSAREDKKEKDKEEKRRVAAARKEEKAVVAAALKFVKEKGKQAAREEMEKEKAARACIGENRSEYERERLATIAENARKMIELGLEPPTVMLPRKKAKKLPYKKQSKELEALKVNYGLLVLVPASAFPDEPEPAGGYWNATLVKDIDVGGRNDVALLIEGEEVFARPATEVITWKAWS